jgi:hypothetical protein
MRTTLTLDEDVSKRVRDFMHRRKVGLKTAVNEMLRQSTAAAASPQGRIRITPHRCGGFRPGVDPRKLGQLLDDLDAESFASKQAQ